MIFFCDFESGKWADQWTYAGQREVIGPIQRDRQVQHRRQGQMRDTGQATPPASSVGKGIHGVVLQRWVVRFQTFGDERLGSFDRTCARGPQTFACTVARVPILVVQHGY